MDPQPNASPSNPPSHPSQPPSGPPRGIAAKVAGQSRPPKAAPRKVAPVNKGGRGTREQEVSAYLSKHGLRAVPIASDDDSPGDAPQPVYLVTPEFVGEVTKTFFQGVEAWRVRNVALRVKTLCGDANLAKEFAESSAAPPGTIPTVAKSMMEISRKHPALLQWAPEVTLAGCLGTWILKDLENMKRLDALEARIRKQLSAAASPQPNAATEAPPDPNPKP